VLRVQAGVVVPDDLQPDRVHHVHPPAGALRHVQPVRHAARRRYELPHPRVRVHRRRTCLLPRGRRRFVRLGVARDGRCITVTAVDDRHRGPHQPQGRKTHHHSSPEEHSAADGRSHVPQSPSPPRRRRAGGPVSQREYAG